MNRPTILTVGRVLPPGSTYIDSRGETRVAIAPYALGWVFGPIDARVPGVPGINGRALAAWSIEELAALALEAGTAEEGDWLGARPEVGPEE